MLWLDAFQILQVILWVSHEITQFLDFAIVGRLSSNLFALQRVVCFIVKPLWLSSKCCWHLHIANMLQLGPEHSCSLNNSLPEVADCSSTHDQIISIWKQTVGFAGAQKGPLTNRGERVMIPICYLQPSNKVFCKREKQWLAVVFKVRKPVNACAPAPGWEVAISLQIAQDWQPATVFGWLGSHLSAPCKLLLPACRRLLVKPCSMACFVQSPFKVSAPQQVRVGTTALSSCRILGASQSF